MKITTKFMLAVALVGSLGLTSCKDYDEDNYAAAITQANKSASDMLDQQIAIVNQTIAALKAQVDSLNSCNCEVKTFAQINDKFNITGLTEQVGTLTGNVTDLYDKYGNLSTEIGTLKTNYDQQIGDLTTNVTNLAGNVVTIQGDVTKINGTIAGLQSDIDALNQKALIAEQVKKLIEDLANNVYTKDEVDQKISALGIDEVKTNLQSAIASITALQNDLSNKADKAELEQFKTNLSDLAAQVEANKNNFDNFYNKEYIDGLQKTLEEQIKAAGNCSCDQAAIKATLQDLQNQITSNLNEISTMKSEMTAVQEAVKNLQDGKADKTALKELEDKLEGYATKDYVDALVNNLAQTVNQKANQSDLDDTNAKLNEAIGKLTANIAKTELLEGNIKTISSTVEGCQTDIANAQEDIKNIKAELSELKTQVEANTTAIAQNLTSIQNNASAIAQNAEKIAGNTTEINNIKSSVSSLEQKINNFETEITNINTNITRVETKLQSEVARLEGIIATISGGTAFDPSELKSQIAENKSRIDALETSTASQIAQLTAMDAQLKSDLESTSTTLYNLYNSLYTNTQIDQMISDASAQAEQKVKEAKDELNDRIDAIEKKLVTADQISDSCNSVRQELKDYEIQQAIITGMLSGAVADLYDTKADKSTVDALSGTVTNISNDLNTVTNNVTNLTTEVNGVKATLETYTQTVDGLNMTVKDIINRLSIAEDAIKQIEINKQNIAALDTRTSKVEAQVETLVSQVSDLYDITDELNGKINSVQNQLAKMVTGIVVQQVWNPVYGSYNSFLTNISTNMLVAYFGEVSGDGESFPQSNETNDLYCAPGEAGQYTVGTDPETGEKEMLLNTDNGYADLGKVYLSVNPADKDFSGLSLSMTNSQDKEGGIQLSKLVKSNATLQLGYTRAAANFYETNATVSAAAIKNYGANISVDKSAIKDAVKKFIDSARDNGKKYAIRNNTTVLIGDLAKVALETAQNIEMDALGVKCNYTDTLGEHAVVSNYNMGALAFQPLSFTFLDNGIAEAEQKYYDKAINLMRNTYKRVANKIVDKINEQIDKKAAKLEQRGITKVENIDNGEYVLVTISYEGSEAVQNAIDEAIARGEGHIYSHDAANKTFVVKYSLRNLSWITVGPDGKVVDTDIDAIDNITNIVAINDVVNITDMCNDLIDEVKTYDEKIADPNNKYMNKLVSYLDRVNAKIQYYIPRLLRPLLVVNSEAGLARAGFAGVPANAKGATTMYLTSYTAEVVAPAWKKYIYITDENGNKIFSKVYSGSTKVLSLSDLLPASGTYNIYYQAMDYTGHVSGDAYLVNYTK